MMKSKRRSLTPEIARKWADMAHLFFIDALSTSTPMTLEKVSFHGGTNLHLSWGSPRYSEDLDFLVTRDLGARILELMPKIEKRMRTLAVAADPDLKVEIRNSTKDPDGLLNFRIVLTSPNVIGKVMAKAEFWQVEEDYLKKYASRFVQPAKPQGIVSRISQPIPAATIEAAFADKVVAIGYRPHLKWRDLFDLWWIRNQGNIETEGRISHLLHHATAYSGPDSLSLKAGLQVFLDRDPDEVFAMADPDLKRWLPRQLWDTLYPEGIREMIENARTIARDVVSSLPEDPSDGLGRKEFSEGGDGDPNPGP